jgi:SAM-dependent methyltransferase
LSSFHGTGTEDFKRRDAASYNDHAAAYGRYIEQLAGPLADNLCRLAELRPGDRVLDIGCGTGVATRKASTLTGHALGVDLSQGMLDEAERVGGAEYRRMDAEALDLESGSYDAVVSLCAVAHFPNLERALQEMLRVLKPGGRLVLASGERRPTFRGILRRSPGYFVAPSAIMGVVSRLPEVEALTEWGRDSPMQQLRRLLPGAATDRCEHAVVFDSSEEFWDAQAAIVTDARKRLAVAPPEAVAESRAEFLRRARSKRLVYPYQAAFLSVRPSSIAAS